MYILEVVEEYEDRWRLMWRSEDDEEYRASLGDGFPNRTEADLALAQDTDEWRTIRAELVAAASPGAARDEWGGFYWPSKRLTQTALRAIKAAWKDRSNVPWPDWAVTASAAGWKPPKGWTP